MLKTTPDEKKTTRGARIILSALGAVLVGLGVTFTGLLWDSFQRSEETRHWQQVPCEVIFSEVIANKPSPNSPEQYRAVIRYRYESGGSVYHSQEVRHGLGPTTDRDKAEARCAQYKVGLKTVCYMNPEQPDKSVLEHTTRAGLYTIWFPLLFVAAGLGMIWSAWKRRRG